jgi:hypothetical protein
LAVGEGIQNDHYPRYDSPRGPGGRSGPDMQNKV